MFDVYLAGENGRLNAKELFINVMIVSN